jgi:hypothetical protein
MTKLLTTTAALTLALATVPTLVTQSKAAPMGDEVSRSEYCKMAKSQRNPVSWNAHYNCLDKSKAQAPVVERKRANPARDPYCDMAKSQRNPVSWNAHYRCLSSR